MSEGDGSRGQEGYMVSDGGFFLGSWGPGFDQAEVAVFYVCGCSGLKSGVSVCVSHEIMDYCVNRN